MPVFQPSRFQLSSLLVLLFCCLGSNANACPSVHKPAIEYAYRVIDQKPHRRSTFTQGLLIDKGILYENSGGFGQSVLSLIDLDSSRLLSSLTMDRRYFGEGLTLWQGKLYQLTWQAKTAFVYDASTLETLGEFHYQGEGWGLTHNGQQLIMSNGSNRLIFRNPTTFKKQTTLQICEEDNPVANLNELEWIKGSIYANIWLTNWLIIIDPSSGLVIGKVDLSELLPVSERQADTDVLNGIAYDAAHDALWVTGKRWPWLYRIELYTKAGTVQPSKTQPSKTLLTKTKKP